MPTTATNNPFAAFGDDPAQIPNQIGRLGCRVLTKKVGGGFVLGTSMTGLTSDFIYEPDTNAHAVGSVILADDFGWTDLRCYGSDFYESPKIDDLAPQASTDRYLGIEL